MNYYPHHIGDFNNATRHLTRVERSIYRDMIELYYDTEQPLTADFKALCRKLLARTNEESTAVEQVLNEFFTKTDQGWYHKRCEEVMQEYRDNISAKSAAGKASAAKREAERLAKLNNSSTAVQQPLESVDSSVQLTKNQEPRTKNQKPVTTKAPPAALPVSALIEMGVPEQVASDWYAIRAKKRLPLTQTALDEMLPDLEKAGMTLEAAVRLCCKRGWAGFEASWVDKQQPRASPTRPALDLAAAQKAANEEAKRRLFGADDGRTIDA